MLLAVNEMGEVTKAYLIPPVLPLKVCKVSQTLPTKGGLMMFLMTRVIVDEEDVGKTVIFVKNA